jgi:excisionase family DNA binding protein
MDFLTTKQVAEKLGITPRRVQALIEVGKLPAQKFGRDYLIKE